MQNLELYDVLDYILNRADSSELDAIRAALRRRESDMPNETGGRGKGPGGLDVRRMAESTAERIEEQLGTSKRQVRSMVHDMVRRMIEQQAPELDEEQIDELFSELVEPNGSPESQETPSEGPPETDDGDVGARDDASERNPAGPGTQDLPRDALVSMIGQFIAYATGTMPVREEMELRSQIDEWQKRYWERFPQVVRRLVTLFLEGAMTGDEFWRGIEDALSE